MWRLVLVASVLLTLALGAVALGSPPPVVVESLTIEKDGAGTTLRFATRFAESFDESAFPPTGTAVVMQQDGNRAKCLTVTLTRTDVVDGLATYVGRFNFIYHASTLTGRADIGGSIFDFHAPLDGTPGAVVRSDLRAIDVSVPNAAAPATVITPQPVVITPDPATIDSRLVQAAPQPEPAVSAEQPFADLVNGLTSNVVAVLGLIVVAVAIVSAYFDRKRSFARTTAS